MVRILQLCETLGQDVRKGSQVTFKIKTFLAVGLLAASFETQAVPTAAWDAGEAVALCSGFTCGVQFTVDDDLAVSSIGGFRDALFEDFGRVGIWDSSGSLLREVSISSADHLLGGYYWEEVASLLLDGGQTYTIGIWTGGDLGAGAVTPGVTGVSSDVSLLNGVFSPFGEGFQLPTDPDPLSRVFAGANFLYEALPVPEPAPLVLISLGFAGLAIARRRTSG